MKTTTLALDRLLRAIGDPYVDLRDIGPGHPEFIEAQVIRAAAGVMAKIPDTFPAIAHVIRSADGPGTSPQSRLHFVAAEAWLHGNPILSAERYASILNLWPRDLLALRLVQSCFFFLGWHDRLCAIFDTIVPAWGNDQPGCDFALAMASFAYAENGDAEYAEALGRKALANDPACPLGVHAVAHAIAESGRPRDGARWMREQGAQWATESRMRTHNAWHLAMFDVGDENLAPALGILDTCLLPPKGESQLEACDAAALLWRLGLQGVDVEVRWRKVSNVFERTMTPGFWPFVDLHAALAHLSAGNEARAQRLEQAIARHAQGSSYSALRARRVTLPGLRALGAWAKGRYGEAAGHLANLQPALDDIGGSRVQLEVFRSIEREAASRQRGGQLDQLRPPAAREQIIRSDIPQIVEEAIRGDRAINRQPPVAAGVKSIAALETA
jgi:hypothetical protein